MAQSPVSLTSGLDHHLNLGKYPFAPFRDANMHTEVLGDKNTCQSEGSGIDDDLDRQAVEQEL